LLDPAAAGPEQIALRREHELVRIAGVRGADQIERQRERLRSPHASPCGRYHAACVVRRVCAGLQRRAASSQRPAPGQLPLSASLSSSTTTSTCSASTLAPPTCAKPMRPGAVTRRLAPENVFSVYCPDASVRAVASALPWYIAVTSASPTPWPAASRTTPRTLLARAAPTSI